MRLYYWNQVNSHSNSVIRHRLLNRCNTSILNKPVRKFPLILENLKVTSFRKNNTITAIPKLHDEFTLFNIFFRRLLSNFFGTGVVLVIQRQLPGRMRIEELAFVWELASRVLLSAAPLFQAQRMRESYPWRYGAMAIYLSISCRDTTLLINWLQGRLPTVSLFQHQTYFRSLGFFLGQAVVTPRYGYNLQGSCLMLAGKISVTGNSRKRSMLARYGYSGASCLEQRLTQSVFLVRTRTGCLGGTIQIFY